MTDLIAEYVAWNLTGERRGQLTLDGITGTLRRLQRDAGPLDQLVTADIDAWWAASRDKSQRTRAKELAHVAAFYDWATKAGVADANPVNPESVRRPKLRQGVPHPVSRGVVDRVTREAPEPVRTILSLAARGGLRAIEIAQIEWSDVDLDNALLHIEGSKGGANRTVRIGRNLRTALAKPSTGPIVRSRRGAVMNPHTVSSTASYWLRRCGIPRVGTLHSYRHYAATEFYRETQDLLATQAFLGHLAISSTTVYAAAASDVQVRGVDAL